MKKETDDKIALEMVNATQAKFPASMPAALIKVS